MKLPLQVRFRNMDRSETVETSIRRRAAKLDTYYDSIMGCRVLVELPHRHHVDGNLSHVRIDLTVRGGEVVVQREASLHATEQQIDEVCFHSEAYTAQEIAAVRNKVRSALGMVKTTCRWDTGSKTSEVRIRNPQSEIRN